MTQLQNAFTLFLSLLVEAIPFLLLGVLLSSALLLFIDEKKLLKIIPKNPLLGAIMGSCIGFLFPVCECGNVPVARRFLIQGLPTSVALGFLLAAPTINPIVIWSTWTAFRDQPEIVVFRVIFSLVIAILISWIFSIQSDPLPLLQTSLANRLKSSRLQANFANTPALLQSGTFILGQPGSPLRLDESLATATLSPPSSLPASNRWKGFLDNMVSELRELGAMLVFGSLVAASLQTFVPREIILNLGQDPLTSIVAMMILAVVVSICSTVDSFFALSFASTFTSSSLLAFLVLGPMIDLKAIGLMITIFKPRMLIYIFALAAQFTFLFTLIHSYFF
ncbi:MAG: putative two-component membrane permease complex subunit SMU_747c [Chroococcopsis gigantea SAG 12.99]|jgi:uncharacterized membrane protein YraQ (UPF0718 family)|nr:permease [Chlorogloea purpurea SAG 13.99]MDV3002163.1 putative two-component membrane permease complex subunit SMU_747c [Chroococcopsis gigantea SAG 12.99]